MEVKKFLECEKKWIFLSMMFVGGYFGAFTYSIRGGIFCNAQTANFVLFGMALGNKRWSEALYYLIPMSAYFMGAFLSEAAGSWIKRFNFLRWDTLLIAIEMVVVVFLGFLPESAPVQITQVLINLICSMQYNTFRQAQGIPMATTFCTNHLRQTGIAFCKLLRHRGEAKSQGYIKRIYAHASMLFSFVIGAIIATMLCNQILGKAIWGALIPLGIVFIDLLYADMKTEKGELSRVPLGH